jgi:hypothetical protein
MKTRSQEPEVCGPKPKVQSLGAKVPHAKDTGGRGTGVGPNKTELKRIKVNQGCHPRIFSGTGVQPSAVGAIMGSDGQPDAKVLAAPSASTVLNPLQPL